MITSAPARGEGDRCGDLEAVDSGADLGSAAQLGRPLRQGAQAEAGFHRGGGSAVIQDRELNRAAADGLGHGDLGGPGVPDHVGQGFLHEPAPEEGDVVGQDHTPGVVGDRDRHAGSAEGRGQRGEVGRAALGQPRRVQSAREQPDVAQRLRRLSAGVGHLRPGPVRVALPHALGELERHHHHRHLMPDAVVQVARDPLPLPERHQLGVGPGPALHLEGEGGVPAALAVDLGEQPGEDEPEAEQEGRSEDLLARLGPAPAEREEDHRLQPDQEGDSSDPGSEPVRALQQDQRDDEQEQRQRLVADEEQAGHDDGKGDRVRAQAPDPVTGAPRLAAPADPQHDRRRQAHQIPDRTRQLTGNRRQLGDPDGGNDDREHHHHVERALRPVRGRPHRPGGGPFFRHDVHPRDRHAGRRVASGPIRHDQSHVRTGAGRDLGRTHRDAGAGADSLEA